MMEPTQDCYTADWPSVMAPLRGQAFLARGDLAAAEAGLASARAVARRLGKPP